MKAGWTDGVPDNLAAAAADASEWLALIERCVVAGAWHFSRADSMPKLRACIEQLDNHLNAEAEKESK